MRCGRKTFAGMEGLIDQDLDDQKRKAAHRATIPSPHACGATDECPLQKEPYTRASTKQCLPPDRFSSTMVTLHVAVGIDLALTRGWAFRYSFLEAIQQNQVSSN